MRKLTGQQLYNLSVALRYIPAQALTILARDLTFAEWGALWMAKWLPHYKRERGMGTHAV